MTSNASAAHLGVGVADQPGGAAKVRGLDYRYQYLAGGVNTGSGWSTWNPDGTFVTRYVGESRAVHVTPVFTYYQLLQSRSSSCADGPEDAVDLCHLRDAALMRAYWADLELFFRRAGGHGRVILHVEPDLFGYLEQHGERALAAGFARHVIGLRDRLARNVELAYHDSIWGTRQDPTYSKPSNAHMAALGARSARWYRSLHARFDYVFHDVADRDAGFRQLVLGDGGRSAWTADDFTRRDAYLRALRRGTGRPLVIWQVPLGNSALDQTWTHYRDNRVEYWLGSRAHLRALRAAGVVALLYGAGAEGCTTAQTDGGLFLRLARAYERAPLRLR